MLTYRKLCRFSNEERPVNNRYFVTCNQPSFFGRTQRRRRRTREPLAIFCVQSKPFVPSKHGRQMSGKRPLLGLSEEEPCYCQFPRSEPMLSIAFHSACDCRCARSEPLVIDSFSTRIQLPVRPLGTLGINRFPSRIQLPVRTPLTLPPLLTG